MGKSEKIGTRASDLDGEDTKPEKRVGRPSKADPVTLAKIVIAVGMGANKMQAARAASICDDTIRAWEKRGEAGEKPFAEFVDQLRDAEQAAKAHLLGVMADATQKGNEKARWAAWMLEKRWPKEFGSRARVDMNVQGRVDLSRLTDAELEKLDQLVGKAETDD
jgi:hypothetical protein